MRQLLLISFVLFAFILINGCGDQGSPGNAKTVYITANFTEGTTGGVFCSYSSGVKPLALPNNLSYTLKSVAYPNTSKIKASDVSINSIDFSFTPKSYDNISISPSFTSSYYNTPYTYSGLLTAGGELKIENIPVLTISDMANICTVAYSNKMLKYDLLLTFRGTELNTGEGVSTSAQAQVNVDCK